MRTLVPTEGRMDNPTGLSSTIDGSSMGDDFQGTLDEPVKETIVS